MGKPGPVPKGEFGAEERARFLELIAGGFGIHMALREMRTNHRRYRLTAKRVRGFRREVEGAIESRRETLFSLQYAAALGGDTDAQRFLMNHEARSREFEARHRLAQAEFKAKQPPKDESDQPRRIVIPGFDDRYDRPQG